MQADKNTSIFLKSYDRSKWKKVRLGDVGNFVSGSGFPLRFQGIKNDELPFLKVSDFSLCKNTNTFNMANNYISKEVAGILNCSIIPAGSIIFAKIGAAISLERKRINKIPVCIDNNMMAFIPTEVSNDFICHLFQTIKLSSYISATALPSLSSKELKNIAILLPPENEQKEISAGIDSVNTHIANLEKQISKYENIKKSTINLLLKPNKDWETVKIKDVFTVTRGLVLSTTEMSKHKTDKTPFPVYSSQTQNNGLIGFYSAFLYQDAITWTTDGANAGFVRFRPGKFYCTNVCGVLLSEKGHANACIATILGSVSKKYVSYVGNPKLMNNVMSEIPISIPPIDQQKAIAQKLGAIDEHINNLKQQLKKQQDLKQGLMQYFFGD